MSDVIEDIRKKLLGLQDLKYKDFISKLIPSVKKDDIIGIKVPVLRKFAKVILKEFDHNQIMSFMKDLPHKYYDENNLHSFLIEKIDDFDNCIYALEDFLPFVNNWSTCDSIVPKSFKKNDAGQRERLREYCFKWIQSEETFTVRFGIEQLMKFYLDDDFNVEYLNVVASVKSQEYYVNMMRAWFFATALSKQYYETIHLLQRNELDTWTYNKTIQKALESKRISGAEKDELRKLKSRNI